MERVFIIAEAGVNHNGSIEIARRLIDVAAAAGADAVKFQTFKADKLTCMNVQKAEYQKQTTEAGESQYDMLKRLELTLDMHESLIDYCNEKQIMFLSTPFDIESVDMLNTLNMSIMKIPSGEITNLPYLRKIAGLKKKIILSTGMSTFEEVEAALATLKEYGAEDITLLHCNTQYPTPAEDVNLRAMVRMKKELHVAVGYSHHTTGIEIPLAATALGASVIEKHFTLDRTMEGPDHRASLEPEELRRMVAGIRKIEQALGSDRKQVSPSEKDNRDIVRKSIVATRCIKRGELFTEENISTKRPGTGVSPMRWDEVIGMPADRDYKIDEIIQL